MKVSTYKMRSNGKCKCITMYGSCMDHAWTIHGPYMIRTRSCMVHRKLRPDLQNLKKSLGNTIDSCHGKSLFALQDLQKREP